MHRYEMSYYSTHSPHVSWMYETLPILDLPTLPIEGVRTVIEIREGMPPQG